MKGIKLLFCALMVNNILFAQHSLKDTVKQNQMLPYVLVFTAGERVMTFLPEVKGTRIHAAKKTALVNFQQSSANRSSNNMRELLSRVPGIHLWESDAGGVQPGIANRGLSPNRCWEFNVRQNGFDIAADPYGYPEAYYNPPATAVLEMEITRGTDALQYGPQFGGMINYKLKTAADFTKKIDVETEQSYLSSNIISSFTGMGFKEKKYGGYAFFNHKGGEGWRENSRFKNNTFYATFDYYINSKWMIRPEITYFDLISQQPGGLKDEDVYEHPQLSLRARNWMGINWLVPGLTLLYQADSSLLWETKISTIFSQRNSILYNHSISVSDTIVPSLTQFANRLLQRDRYNNLQMESRVKKEFGKKEKKNVITFGIRYFNGNTHRLADGKGTSVSNYDIRVIGDYNKDIAFQSSNFAFFSENLIRINNKLLVTMGSRIEAIKGSASGRNGFVLGNPVMLLPLKKSRLFVLFGAGLEYHFTKSHEIYGSATQCYRPLLFSNLQSPPGNDEIDSELKDSKGYVIDLGYRSKWDNNFSYDFSMYYLRYANKTGTLIKQKDSILYRLLTNIGDSYSVGVEAYIEWKKKYAWHSLFIDLNLFASYAFNDSRYAKDLKDSLLSKNCVENAPKHILRSGGQIAVNKCFAGFQFSYTDHSFSDALNTRLPSTNAQTGLIPSYAIMDLNFGYAFNSGLRIQFGCNNLNDRKYFTRRTGGLPGPGALPADGRVFYFSFIKRID